MIRALNISKNVSEYIEIEKNLFRIINELQLFCKLKRFNPCDGNCITNVIVNGFPISY